MKWVVTKMREVGGFVIGEQAARCRKDDMKKWLKEVLEKRREDGSIWGKKCAFCRKYLNKNGVMRQIGEEGKEVAQNGHAAFCPFIKGKPKDYEEAQVALGQYRETRV